MQEERQAAERFAVDPQVGLHEKQVTERREQGLTNRHVSSATKTTGDIIRDRKSTRLNSSHMA